MDDLLQVKGLRTYFVTEEGSLPAVDGVTFSMKKGETLALVGESGCGKTVTALSIMRLIASPPGKYVAGEILFEGEDILKKSEKDMQITRGNDIAMVFQEPMTSLNPVLTIGYQISEAVILHQKLGKADALERAETMLELVGVPDPQRRLGDYPHQLSGGLRQRVMMAMALSCNPKILIADEPTTALDVTIQAQLLELLKDLRAELGMAILLITHDLGVVAEICERVAVMYAGKIVEESEVTSLFERPIHPYTEGLLSCIPKIGSKSGKLAIIEGVVPSLSKLPEGCRFHPRCAYAQEICRQRQPELRKVEGRLVACHFTPSERTSQRLV